MALEISEIGIHVRVPDGSGPAASEGGDGGPGGGGLAQDERARLVDECVRRVLRILAQREER